MPIRLIVAESVTTYQTVERENRSSVQSSVSIFSHHWRRLILDEAHTIRNHNTSTAQAMTAIRATSRWAVSGTPIQNSLLDFHGLFKFLHFSPYDDPKVFDDAISNLWRVKPVDEAAETFKKLLSCVMIRRTKAILDLPSRDDKLMRVPFSHEEEEHYRQIEQPVVDMLDRTTEKCVHTHHISSKVWALVSQIRSYPQEKHVVFSSWTSSLDMVEKALRCDPNYIIQSVRIDGKVQPKNRGHVIQQLHEDSSIRVILITIACGACGLDLTAASRVHLLEPQWNPSLEDQALARVHRLGQTRPVTTIRYVMEDSFEEHILKVQDRKKLLATTLLSRLRNNQFNPVTLLDPLTYLGRA
ncbi:HepA Superfamily II DNA-RNA helicase- SNF2 family [Pyrenophora tritici-repentis]|nr:HepA Superfamily II DNA-RNA helicase- SNF2 family [Pyrenophora tritici-repentis]